MSLSITKTVANFSQIAMPSFVISTKICVMQVVVKIVESYSFRRLVIELVDNFLVMNSMDVLSRLLLLLHMILPSFPEHLALKVNINCLIEAYKLSAILQDSFTPFIAHIKEMNLCITNFWYFCLTYIVSKEES